MTPSHTAAEAARFEQAVQRLARAIAEAVLMWRQRPDDRSEVAVNPEHVGEAALEGTDYTFFVMYCYGGARNAAGEFTKEQVVLEIHGPLHGPSCDDGDDDDEYDWHAVALDIDGGTARLDLSTAERFQDPGGVTSEASTAFMDRMALAAAKLYNDTMLGTLRDL